MPATVAIDEEGEGDATPLSHPVMPQPLPAAALPSFGLAGSGSRGAPELLRDVSAVGPPPGAIASLRAMAGVSGAREGLQEVLSLRSAADVLEAGDEVCRVHA